jgi:hypothetical protein
MRRGEEERRRRGDKFATENAFSPLLLFSSSPLLL